MNVSGPTVTLLSPNARPIRLQGSAARPAPANKPMPVDAPTVKAGIPVAEQSKKTAPAPAGTITTDVSAPLTVEGLLEKWHEADERYDLNKDGIVGMADLNMLLEKLSATAAAETAPAGDAGPAALAPEGLASAERTDAPATTGPAEPLGTDAALAPDAGIPETTLQGLLDAWHTASEQFDFDGDGSVGMGDLNALLARLNAPATPAVPETPAAPTVAPPPFMEPAAPSTAVATVAETAAAPAVPEVTIESLLDAWGRNDPTHDLNGDGRVGMADLNALLERLSRIAGRDEPAGPRVTAHGASQKLDHGMDALGRAVTDRLRAAGFDERPPRNVHQLVDHMNLQPAGAKALMSRLAAAYPQGLGVNRVG